jgi:hypothetical protein
LKAPRGHAGRLERRAPPDAALPGLNKPLDAQTFVRAIKARLTIALAQFNHALPHLSHLRIIRPKNKPERGLWALAKLEPQPEPHSLSLIKEAISQRYGILDLLDVFVEADRTVDFTRFFTHSGTKEMRGCVNFRATMMRPVTWIARTWLTLPPSVPSTGQTDPDGCGGVL